MTNSTTFLLQAKVFSFSTNWQGKPTRNYKRINKMEIQPKSVKNYPIDPIWKETFLTRFDQANWHQTPLRRVNYFLCTDFIWCLFQRICSTNHATRIEFIHEIKVKKQEKRTEDKIAKFSYDWTNWTNWSNFPTGDWFSYIQQTNAGKLDIFLL